MPIGRPSNKGWPPSGNGLSSTHVRDNFDRMRELAEPPRLRPPSTGVRESWLAAERAACAAGGSPEVLDAALADFDWFVAARQGTLVAWDVPCTFWWWTSGAEYLGELVIRHELTPALLTSGGHLGYEVAAAWRRQGHGTAMLAAGLAECARLGLRRVLLTIDADNVASRRVCLANGGVLEGRVNGEDRYWIAIESRPPPCAEPPPPTD